MEIFNSSTSSNFSNSSSSNTTNTTITSLRRPIQSNASSIMSSGGHHFHHQRTSIVDRIQDDAFLVPFVILGGVCVLLLVVSCVFAFLFGCNLWHVFNALFCSSCLGYERLEQKDDDDENDNNDNDDGNV